MIYGICQCTYIYSAKCKCSLDDCSRPTSFDFNVRLFQVFEITIIDIVITPAKQNTVLSSVLLLFCHRLFVSLLVGLIAHLSCIKFACSFVRAISLYVSLQIWR